jgi:HK97 gp10 family phage protein
MPSVTLQGYDEIIKAVRQLPDKMKADAIGNIIKTNMQPIARSIKNNTPVREEMGKDLNMKSRAIIRKRKDGSISTSSLPGNLRASIGVKIFKKKGKDISGFAGIQGGKNDGWYGYFLERGTKYISKQQFIARAAAITVPIAQDNLENDIIKYITSNAKKLGLDAR